MGSEESHYLDSNIDRVRTLCRSYDVPFTAKKARKCGRQCKILSRKKDYLKVRFQDNSVFWFPIQAIKLKRPADRWHGGVDENGITGSTLNSEYQIENSANWCAKS